MNISSPAAVTLTPIAGGASSVSAHLIAISMTGYVLGYADFYATLSAVPVSISNLAPVPYTSTNVVSGSISLGGSTVTLVNAGTYLVMF